MPVKSKFDLDEKSEVITGEPGLKPHEKDEIRKV